MTVAREFRWASEVGRHEMPYPEELEYLGYTRVSRHPNYPTAWLMRRGTSPKAPSDGLIMYNDVLTIDQRPRRSDERKHLRGRLLSVTTGRGALGVRGRKTTRRSLPDRAETDAAFHEVKENPPRVLAHTRRKFGAKRAEAQRRAIALSKARRGDV